MFRKPSGSHGFSFGRLMTNSFPNFANDNAERDATLTVDQQNAVYGHQLSLANPLTLDQDTFWAAGFCDAQKISKQVYNGLVKEGILHNESSQIDVDKIGPNTTHHLSVVSVHIQRAVIGLLFWWIEEQQRLNKLFKDLEEVDGLIASSDGGEKLRMLEAEKAKIQAQIRQRPGDRRHDTHVGGSETAGEHEQLPAYSRQVPGS